MKNILIINKSGLKYTGAKIRNLNLATELSKREKIVHSLATDKYEIFKSGKKIFQKKINLINFFFIFFKQYDFWLSDIIIFSLLLKKNLIFTIHDIKEWGNYGRGGLLKKILIYLIVKKSKICITLSVSLKNFLSKKFNKKFYVVKNGLSPQWKKKPKKRSLREKYLIYVSNYLSHKNHLSLLNFQNYFNYKILLVGKPTEPTGKKTYETLKKNKSFKFFFNVSEVELQSLVKNSEFVLFPSKLEGFGIPIIEALSQEKNILIEKDLKKQLPIFSKCKKLFFHDFSKKIDTKTIKKLLSKISCKKCIYNSFQWKKSVDDLEKIIKKNLN